MRSSAPDCGLRRESPSAAAPILWLAGLVLAGAGGVTGVARAEEERLSGSLCIAPFHVEARAPGEPPNADPILSQTTWPPSAQSVFEFRIDGRPPIAVRNHEQIAVTGLAIDREVKVEVRLDGKPFESFRLELAEKPGHRICLWLYEGYWHWIDNGWEPKLGCRCGEEEGGDRP